MSSDKVLLCANLLLVIVVLASGSSVHLYLKAHPGADPWEYLSRPQTRARALEALRRRVLPSAYGHAPIPSQLPLSFRRLSDSSHLRSQSPPASQSNASSSSAPRLDQSFWRRQQTALSQPASQTQVFVGIFTAASPSGAVPYSKHDYAARRAVLRRTWIAAARQYDHVAVRFVAGRPHGASSNAGGGSGDGGGSGAGGGSGGGTSSGGRGDHRGAGERGGGGTAAGASGSLAAEAERHGDFLWLDVEDSYWQLSNKTLVFFATVLQQFPHVQYIVKADDDLVILPQRLLLAADQWTAAGADLVSCMTHGPVRHNPRHKWYDPAALLVGARYPLRPQGTLYVLSARAARILAARNGTWRMGRSTEDVSVGRWLLGSDAVFWEDARLCRRGCEDAAVVALFDPRATGLELEALAAAGLEPACTAPAAWPLPYASALSVGLEPWLEERREAAAAARRP